MKASKDAQRGNGPIEEKFELTDEMKDYIEMKRVSGLKTPDLEDDSQRHAFVKEFNSWKKRGKPRTKMPDVVVPEDPIPMKLYRIKILGRQKIFWRDTKANMYGKEEVDTAVTTIGVNAATGEQVETPTGRTRNVRYTLDYTKELGEKLVNDALHRCVNPTFYFIVGERKWSVSPEQFNADFDEIVKGITNRKD